MYGPWQLWEVTDNILPDVEKFVCALYGQEDSAGVNAARDNLVHLTWRSDALPSNQDDLKHHIARENYLIAIHRCCFERSVGHGSGRWTTVLQIDGKFSCTTICAEIYKLQVQETWL